MLEDLLSPWEPSIMREGTYVAAMEITILGMSELK